MNSAIERLVTLRASDLMSPDVVTVAANQTMTTAAAILSARNISGAPVIDELGRFCGILSANDFVARDSSLTRGLDGRDEFGECHRLAQVGDSPYSLEAVAEDLVRCHMTSAVQTISPETPLLVAARIMCSEHIHRLPVVDNEGRLAGLVTSLDLVAAMIKAVEE